MKYRMLVRCIFWSLVFVSKFLDSLQVFTFPPFRWIYMAEAG
uniref:Uncharacterized protein n=1 Tax=Arundo donax TaxID=35708 RepID=A0A0A9GYR6_ARUDO